MRNTIFTWPGCCTPQTERKPAGNARVISFDDNSKKYKVSYAYIPSSAPEEIEVPESRVISLASEVLKSIQSSKPSNNEDR